MYRWRNVHEGYAHLIDDVSEKTACGVEVFYYRTGCDPGPRFCHNCANWMDAHVLFTEDDAKALVRLEKDLR